MDSARELIDDGIAALRAKDLRQAEMFFLEACQAYARKGTELSAQEFAYHKAACYGLGRVYRLTGRYELAVIILERALPNPVAFKDLVNAFRFLASVSQKEGDLESKAAWYNRMYSLARVHQAVSAIRLADSPKSMDWQKGAKWIEELHQQHGTIYAFRFEGQEVEGDTLLSREDYEALAQCRRQIKSLAVQSLAQPVIPLDLGAVEQIEAPELDLGLGKDYSWSTMIES